MVRYNRGRKIVDGTLTVLAIICFLPCICMVGGRIIAKDVYKKARKYERPKARGLRESKKRKSDMIRATPKRVDPRLERHLTIGRPGPGKTKDGVDQGEQNKDDEPAEPSKSSTVTHRQDHTWLFRLPLEIRRKIYEEVLGGYVIHIYMVEAYRRMSHTRCKIRSPEVCRGRPCRQLFRVKGVRDEWGNICLLSLLQSCRRM
jgi:hypothetical protein